jgi:hypothetical protein
MASTTTPTATLCHGVCSTPYGDLLSEVHQETRRRRWFASIARGCCGYWPAWRRIWTSSRATLGMLPRQGEIVKKIHARGTNARLAEPDPWPNPLTQREQRAALRKALGRPPSEGR